jgi:hypothetical protein
MVSRNLLAFNKLEDFKLFLLDQNCTLLDPVGDYEVLRWTSDRSEAMPIIYKKLDAKVHFSCNEVADGYVRAWLWWRKAQKNMEHL